MIILAIIGTPVDTTKMDEFKRVSKTKGTFNFRMIILAIIGTPVDTTQMDEFKRVSKTKGTF